MTPALIVLATAAGIALGIGARRWYRRVWLGRIHCRACKKAELVRAHPHDGYRWVCEGCGSERDIGRPRITEQTFETWRAGQTFSSDQDARKAYDRWHEGQENGRRF